MDDAIIVRHKVSQNFTILDNNLINDSALTWKALGILIWLVSRPPNFKLRLCYLAKLRPTGRDGTRSGIKELEEQGYINIVRERDRTGKFLTTTWEVSDRPEFKKEVPATENPVVANPNAELSEPEKATLTSNGYKEEITKTNTPVDPEENANQASAVELIYPKVSPTEVASLEKAISILTPGQQQAVLDEVEGKRRRGKLRIGAVPLARYLVANIDKFIMIDGIAVRVEREQQSGTGHVHKLIKARTENEDQRMVADFISMTDEQFLELARKLPPAMKRRIEKRRTELIAEKTRATQA